ncbi:MULTISPECIES: MmgE/PrpD family protein [unclassified Brenneria]|uniref:MmgE/PrpD family protein n=1 Tax=unclassified Brenneria TaxID=2634434 RepID=UPI001554D853|nr:MmgE/PrpD family protein [Brenneria sp. hezel4-2-4]MEE3651750.1 MmgE/PrpD family protein [Brenneria sp. HEZEL_4_2_4]NPD01706.1 immunity protein [Brenneria sp. hezel4-2-4]
MTNHTDLTVALAHAITHSLPDQAAIDAARLGVTDFIATALPITQGAIADSGLTPLKQVFSATDSLTNSLILGYVGHALDFDDYHPAFRGHPSTVILPALFALAAENPQITEKAFLTAYVIGVEVAGRSGLASGSRHYSLGYHTTATLGAIAAAAAAARLSGASVEQTQTILGLAATQAAGLRAQFGSAVKPLHAGLAARAGLTAVKLGLAGFNGNTQQVLDAFLAAHGDQKQQPELLIQSWGAPWRILSPGLEFKRYPTCGGTHSAAEAAFALREQWAEQHDANASLADSIESITVTFPPGGDIAPFICRAATGVEARFSLEYVIAAALLEGELQLTRFAEGPVDPKIASLADKVQRIADETAPPDELDPDARFHEVTLFLRDGAMLTSRVTRQETAAKPTDLGAKLKQNINALPHLDAEQILARCQLNTSGDLGVLLRLLLP